MKTAKALLCAFMCAVLMLIPLSGCRNGEKNITSLEDLSGKSVGVLTGSVHDRNLLDVVPDAKIEYMNSFADTAVALDAGKLSAYVSDQPVARLLLKEYPGHQIIGKLKDENYAFIFQKDNPESALLCSRFNEFLAKIKVDGTLKEIDYTWFETDNSSRSVDFSDLTGENGVLKLNIASDVAAPFAFVENGQYAGYEVDIAARFCREYGYALEIVDSNFTGLLSSVASGKCDFGASCITVTEERSQSMLFSEPDYFGGSVVIAKKPSRASASGSASGTATPIKTIEDMDGKRIGIVTGTVDDAIAAKHLTKYTPVYVNNVPDLALSLESGKSDAIILSEPAYRSVVKNSYPDIVKLGYLESEEYGFIFGKGGYRSAQLCSQMNDYIAQIKMSGVLDELDRIWFEGDESKKVVQYPSIPAKNGILKLAVASDIGEPFAYLKDGRYVGYEVDIAARFCRKYGYGLEIIDGNFPGLLAAVTSGKCDFGASCVTITDERRESMYFSTPDYYGGVVVAVKDSGTAAQEKTPLSSISESFNRTFIRESRWKLFVSGIGTTLLISTLSALFGTVLGFLVYLLCRKGSPVPNGIVKVLITLLERTPVVVVLMVLYYVIFGSIDVSGVVVSIIGFTLLFAAKVFAIITGGVNAVDIGQVEASLALGYNDHQTFMRNILPQAIEHILPGYKGAVVSLIKDTAVVGYIAVQDLTKVSDIVRSRTYEAFFPIIATAVIYFVIAWLLTVIIEKAEIRFTPKSRTAARILKGVKTE